MSEVKQVEVLIIGAGPAGSVCGSLLRRSGTECIIVDHATFPRDKVCGGGLTVKAWRLLDMLLPDIKYDYRPISRMRLQFEDDPVCEFEAEYPIRMTQRKEFDNSLLQYYLQTGGELIKGSFARFEQQADGRILVTLKSGQQFSCRYLVAADGANSLIRRQIHGPIDMKHHALFLEYYVEGEYSDDVFVHFSDKYRPGCFYKFSSNRRDIYGFVSAEDNENVQLLKRKFSDALTRFDAPEGHMRGAYIPLETVESSIPNVILIGDAGGFPNKLTGEGLYDAFKTAYYAKQAIVENKPFSETNREEFEKMKRQEKVYQFFFSKTGLRLVRWVMKHPHIAKWLFDAKMKRETFRKK